MSAFLHVPVQFIIRLSISKSFNATGDNVNLFELFQTPTIRHPHIKRYHYVPPLYRFILGLPTQLFGVMVVLFMPHRLF